MAFSERNTSITSLGLEMESFPCCCRQEHVGHFPGGSPYLVLCLRILRKISGVALHQCSMDTGARAPD